MSDPDAPQPEKPTDVDDVVGSANAGLDAAAAAGADVPGSADAPDHKPADAVDEKIVDPDLAAFEAAERDHPGTFASPPPAVTPAPIVE
ncbi:ABC transporter, partial [Microbacterium sp. AGC62]